MTDTATSQAATVLGKMKQNAQNVMLDKFQLSTNKLIEIGMYLCFGFLFGYALKRFSGLVLVVILTFVGLIVLQQFDVIHLSVNALRIKEFFGVQNLPDATVMSTALCWLKDNIMIVVSFIVGFLLGIRLA